MQDLVVVVTGSKTYNYLKLGENLKSIEQVHSSIPQVEQMGIAPEYTCHTWAKDTVQLVVATASGHIIVCNMKGELVISVPEAPIGSRIDSMITYSRGLLFAGEDGMIWPFEATAHESQIYRPQ